MITGNPEIDWKIIGTLLDAWEGTSNDFKSDVLDQYPSLHASLQSLYRFAETGASPPVAGKIQKEQQMSIEDVCNMHGHNFIECGPVLAAQVADDGARVFCTKCGEPRLLEFGKQPGPTPHETRR